MAKWIFLILLFPTSVFADCELWVRVTNGPGGRIAGQIVASRPSGFNWGTGELNSIDYVILKVVGKTLNECQIYAKRHIWVESTDKKTSAEVRSKYRIDIEALNPTLKDEMLSAKEFVVINDWDTDILPEVKDDEAITLNILDNP